MNNLFISYDLNAPGQRYDKVEEAIKALGNWAKVQKSFWYVNSMHSVSEAAQRVWAVMDGNDSLIVVDASHNLATMFGVAPKVSQYIIDQWTK